LQSDRGYKLRLPRLLNGKPVGQIFIMSIEENIRDRHAFDKAVSVFLDSLAGFTVEEVELSLGRVADQTLACSDPVTQAHLQVRGRVLHLYLELRQSNLIAFKRSELKNLAKVVIKREALIVGKKKHEELVDRWKSARVIYEEAILVWEARQASRSWIGRFFGKFNPPYEPGEPPPQRHYVELYECRISTPSNLSERLIDYAATYSLPVFPGQPETILRDSLLLLSQKS
jgi:hypothetical protein